MSLNSSSLGSRSDLTPFLTVCFAFALSAVTKSADQDEKHLLVDERIFKEVFHRAFNFAT